MSTKHKSISKRNPPSIPHFGKRRDKCIQLDIMYCGTLVKCLPETGEETEHILTENAEVYMYVNGQWEKRKVVDCFYFYDDCKKALFFVDVQEKVVKRAKFNGRLLGANTKLVYDALDCYLKVVCDLTDTESITKITLVSDEDEVLFTPLDRIIKFSKYGDFYRKELIKSGNDILVDVSSLEEGKAKTLIYFVDRNDCDGKQTLVNHIFLRFNVSSGSSSNSETSDIEPLITVEDITEGDPIRLVRTDEDTAKVRKIKDSGTLENSLEVTPSDVMTRDISIATDKDGNVFYLFTSRDGVTFTLPDLGLITTPSAPRVVYVLKRHYNGTFLWIKSITHSETTDQIGGITIDESGSAYITFKYTQQPIMVGLSTVHLSNTLGQGVAKIDKSGVWQWITGIIPPSGGITARNVATNGKSLVAFSNGFFSNTDGAIEIRTPNVIAAAPIYTTSGSVIGILYSSSGLPAGISTAGPDELMFARIDMNANGDVFAAGEYERDNVYYNTNGTTPFTTTASGSPKAIISKVDYRGFWQKVVIDKGTGTSRALRVKIDPNGNLYAYIEAVGNGSAILGNETFSQNVLSGFYNMLISKMTQSLTFTNTVFSPGNFQGTYGGLSVDKEGNAYVFTHVISPGVLSFIQTGTKFIDTVVGQNTLKSMVSKVSGGSWVWTKTSDFRVDNGAIDNQQNIHTAGLELGFPLSFGKFSQDPQERMKGISQTSGTTGNTVNVKLQSNLVVETNETMFPGTDYNVNKEGNLDIISSVTQTVYPTAKYFGTSLSKQKLLLNE